MAATPTLLLLADFTAQPLANAITAAQGRLAVTPMVGPYDRIFEVLGDGNHACWSAAPTFVFVWTQPDRIMPAFAALCRGEGLDEEALRHDFEVFADLLKSAASRARTIFVASWCLPPWFRGLGPQALNSRSGLVRALHRLNGWLMDVADEVPNLVMLDAARWLAAHGEAGWEPRMWYMAKVPFAARVFQTAAAEAQAAIGAILGQRRKLIVLDLDDTLWGGTVGEDGWEALRLGGHDPVGEALVDFQRGLKALSAAGIMLGVVSKNTEAVALEAIDRHPEMVLRRADLVGWRINWNDKAANIVELAKELNIGLDAVVFIDNDAVERDRVRQALPMVLVPDWPLEKTSYPKALAQLTCFDAIALSVEDAVRTHAYVSDRARRASSDTFASRDDWLGSLGIELRVTPLLASDMGRACQLLNKTNQMNLRTRRMTEAELAAWAAQPDHRIMVARVQDRFGDYGLTGLLGISVRDGEVHISDFVLSCRVMGRGVEQALLHVAWATATALGCASLTAELLVTDRNIPCRELLDADRYLAASPEAPDVYRLDVTQTYPSPSHISLQWDGAR